MSEAPAFFLPGARPDTLENDYAEFARWCGRPVPERGRRIYSIEYRHDGIEWVATVGQQLHGTARRVRRRGGKKVEESRPVSDPATVLAIFAGVPFMVVTNQGIVPGVRSAWVNPFMAGQPEHVTYFTEPG